jgi:hypothetical protein
MAYHYDMIPTGLHNFQEYQSYMNDENISGPRSFSIIFVIAAVK